MFAAGAALVLAGCGQEAAKEDEHKKKSAKVTAGATASKEVTGEFIVIERTETPNPKTSDYADCLYTAKLQVVAVDGGLDGKEETSTAGTTDDNKEPHIILAAMPAFLNRKLQAGQELAVGDRFRARWIAFDEAPEKFRKMQTADKFGDYLLEYCLVTEAKLVRRGAPITAAAAKGAQEKMPEIPQERFIRAEGAGVYAERRKARMSRELARMKSELDANGGSWEAWMKKLEPYQEELETRAKEAGGTLKQDQHVFARLGLQCYFDLTQDDPQVGPLAALRLLNAELQRHGIDLVVVPFPNKEDVNAHKFLGNHPDAPTELNPCRIRCLMRMLEHDIEVIDLVPALRAGLGAHPFVYYDNRDTHPADGGIQIAANEAAKVLADYDLLPANHTLLPTETTEFVIEKDMEYFTKGARYPAHRVLFPADAKSHRAVLLQGDSFLSVPTNYVANATIADHIGRHLGYRPDKLVREAGANLILQDLARLPKSELEGRKVLFFVFGPTRLRSPHSPLMSPELHWHLALLPE
ncbi:hypothetical protein [Roseimicrobium sp. ORNL1]|uniref:alginate O-acetyltransferase AlgX-related protein n=1 Tax=Roseimicrobium sp. ORNL1 TaxID=2711231 RepID=UPI0013E0F07E|nr:hypothetical protein [Roseimicrobium sp. ORNL1]QIF02145.1 hypothetical protein G5S37_11575 [Roseimicrobium sp. ORNL1]